MRVIRASIVLAGLIALLAVGCSEQTTGPKTADYEQQRAEIIARRAQMRANGGTQASAPTPVEEAAPDGAGMGTGGLDYVYDPLGKRDPFRSFVLDRLKELAAAIERAKATLTTEQRQALEASQAIDIPLSKALEELGCSHGAFKKRLKRARKRLSELLVPFLDDEDDSGTT